MHIVGKAVFAIEGDDTGVIAQASVAQHAGRLWLVATWLRLQGGSAQVPEWLLPLDALGHHDPTPVPLLALQRAVARELVDGSAPPEAMQRVGAVRNPALVQPQAPGTSH